MAKRVTASVLIARLKKRARPGVSESQLADVLLDAFVQYATIPPSCVHQVTDMAVERLRQLEWDDRTPSSGGEK